MIEEADPYEEQLLAVFRSCDCDGAGVLNRKEFFKLCDTLQLDEHLRGQLIERLHVTREECDVTFIEFRDALLAVLASSKASSTVSTPVAEQVIEREVSPRFVFGVKKYGRRSRPSSADEDDELRRESLNGYQNNMELDLKLKQKTEIDSGNAGVDIDILCKHLGVEKDKAITKSELTSVCNSLSIPSSVYNIIKDHILKMDANDEECDKELTYGKLFEIIKNAGCLTSDYVSPVMTPTTPLSNLGVDSTTAFNEDGISGIDINISGYMAYDTLVYMLENAGIAEAGTLLAELGVSPQMDANLSRLAGRLHEELATMQRCADESAYTTLDPHLLLLQASVVVSQAQIKWYRSCMEQMQCERDKIRNDLMIANERASLLAQEVDDNHARMEKSVQQKIQTLEQKHAEHIKKLTYQCSAEREHLANQNLKLEKQLEQLLHDETKLRSEVASLKQDYETLEKENRTLLDQLVDAEHVKIQLEQEIQRLSSLKRKVLELESSNEQAISFLEKLNQLQEENVKLRDRNDELVIELENATLRQTSNRTACSKRRGGNFPMEADDQVDADIAAISTHRMFPKVRKFSAEKELSIGFDGQSDGMSSGLMHSESGVEADISISSSSLDKIDDTSRDSNDTLIIELKSRVSFLENIVREYQLKLPADVDEEMEKEIIPEEKLHGGNLEKQCETLQMRLNQVQKEILKILSEKRACSEENCALKKRILEMRKRLLCTAETGDPADEMEKSGIGDLSEYAFELDESYQEKSVVEKESVSDEYLTVTSTQDEVGSAATRTADSCSSAFVTVSEASVDMEWRTEPTQSSADYDRLTAEYAALKAENKSLLEKCDELNNCLDLMRAEYEQCEEYWGGKLDEERKLFEEEQRINDQKFAELQAKIEEYGEMFEGNESNNSLHASKLPPIVENDLEKEITDLQDEFRAYKERTERENEEKQREIERLMQIISLYESNGKSNNSEIGQSLDSIKSDRTYVLENPTINLSNMPTVEDPNKSRVVKDLKQKKKYWKNECYKLEREKEELYEVLIKLKSERKAGHRRSYNTCSHIVQQRNTEIAKNNLLLRLRHQEVKNRQLRNMILQQQKKLKKTMQDMLEQHEKELNKYKSALTSSQEMWHSLQQTTEKQSEQIAMSDVLVKELYCENSQLMATIHQLEQQHLDCPSPVLL